ncbi:dTDP-4-dehydrorhamnose 3,5-epimerase [Paenibacillus kobensis]|uniref:dTDP-4-dehydrorhamnose 3,5-epimerase n=1 Tax=Paenibacillus kobensis TaxID=59841 RepID=UPI000FD7949B|nr:dTDP-4-dehydrorhamnose 3,5-epimerase [Paenibacillus kobensis]
MLVHPTPLQGAALLEMEPISDNRGYFARSFCKKTLAEHGLSFNMVQANTAFNRHRDTLRGMHYQKPPYCEDKIVTCTQGAIYDVIIDLNEDSPTYCQWYGINLTEDNNLSLYIPKGFAHGYLTLTDNAGIHYLVSEYYTPSHESGVRWNDPAFGIEWPNRDSLLLSMKDEKWGNFDKTAGGLFVTEGVIHE